MSQHNPVLRTAKISWQNDTPHNDDFNDCYYSNNNGIEESAHVFLKGNQLPQRWQDFESSKRVRFSILETGFGSGLNFLTTAEYWLKFRNEQNPKHLKKLTYTSVEGFPLAINDLIKITTSWPIEFSLTDQLVKYYPASIEGIYCINFEAIELRLIFMPLDKALAQFEPKGIPLFDCLYLDGFAPSRNESMWNSSLLRQVGYLCKQHSSCSTFTVASKVRRDLTNASYDIKKVKGFGSKRESLTGIMARSGSIEYKSKTPWYDSTIPKNTADKTVTIIGAGVAGCATAYCLARQGIACRLIDSKSQPGGTIAKFKASAFSPFITADFNYTSQFYWQAYTHLEHYLSHHSEVNYDLCGVYLIANTDERKKIFHTAYRLLKSSGMKIKWLNTTETKNNLGLEISYPGLFINHGGWVNANNFCASLINHPLVSTHFNNQITDIKKYSHGWLLNTKNQTIKTKNLILCNGSSSNFVECYELGTLRKFKGQVTPLSKNSGLSQLNTILNNGHYLLPTKHHDELIVGSNYDQATIKNRATVNADIDNITALKGLNDELTQQVEMKINQLNKSTKSSSNCGIRLVSRDHMPIIGAIPDMKFYREHYPGYLKSGRLKDCPKGKYLEGLYVNTAHGSRGITASLLSGEIIAAMFTGQQIPLSTKLYHAVHPARFFVRDVLSSSSGVCKQENNKGTSD